MSFNLQSSYATANANTDVTVTLTGVTASVAPAATSRHTIKQLVWSLTGDPAAAIAIHIKDSAGTTLCNFDVTKGGPGFMPFADKGLPCTLALNTVITIDLANDSAVTGKLTVIWDWE